MDTEIHSWAAADFHPRIEAAEPLKNTAVSGGYFYQPQDYVRCKALVICLG
jgi:hypothetical protein